jgi:hypothetical protein
MSETIGYENVKCEVGVSPKCRKKNAGFHRYGKYFRVGPVLDCCEACVRVPYEQPPQFKEKENAS